MLKDVYPYLSEKIREKIIEFIANNSAKDIEDSIEEIRIRMNKQLTLKIGQELVKLQHIVEKEELEEIFENICEKSIYSYTKQISQGFITIKGGNRVGIVGTAVIEDEKVINLNYISSLNFRIAKQIKDVSIPFLKYIIDIGNNTIFNTLLVSPPGIGKTTVLRDLTRKISNGMEEINFLPKTCGLIDERSEIAAIYKGEPQNDIGINTDVIDNIPKSIGITMLIRSMSPQIIICDEIGSLDDIKAIEQATCSGVKGIFSAHGSSKEEIMQNQNLKRLIENKLIERIIIFNRNGVKNNYEIELINNKK